MSHSCSSAAARHSASASCRPLQVCPYSQPCALWSYKRGSEVAILGRRLNQGHECRLRAYSESALPLSGGCLLGACGATVVISGGVAFWAAIEFFAYQASREYFGFVDAVSLREGKARVPDWLGAAVTVCCMGIPAYTFLSKGGIAVGLAASSFAILSIIANWKTNAKLSHLSSAVFGLVYCGVLPAYWLKLRLVAIPALHTTLAVHWPTLLGGLTHITVGLIATFTTIACVVAADVGAYFVGKTWGRTKLTVVSPNKTCEGAAGGLVACVACALALRSATAWPAGPGWAAGLGAVVWASALLGDLIESVMKRDAGVKDSGSLIPGHGGILDRFDSYVFTAALAYLYLQASPMMGV